MTPWVTLGRPYPFSQGSGPQAAVRARLWGAYKYRHDCWHQVHLDVEVFEEVHRSLEIAQISR